MSKDRRIGRREAAGGEKEARHPSMLETAMTDRVLGDFRVLHRFLGGNYLWKTEPYISDRRIRIGMR
ncbi:hypothetical protein B5K05_33400 [Rhizobium phaseoli]|nr:hypothetical protein B5K05_33400 [Rhizobium phaseoli]